MDKIIKVQNEYYEFEVKEGNYFISSLDIAKRFNKEHKNIIRLIEFDNETLEEFLTGLKIEPSSYKDSTGRTLKMYLLDRDAFSYFVMGFTGREAKRWKLNYIKAFNEMERQLREVNQPKQLTNSLDVKTLFECASIIEKEFNINGVETIKRLEGVLKDNNLAEYAKLLPSYTNNKFVGTSGEVNNRVGHAYSYFYKSPNYATITLTAIKFNKLAYLNDYYTKKDRIKSNGKIKSWWVLKDEYLKYGKNIVAKQNSIETQIHLYDDSINEFYNLVTATRDLDPLI